MKYAKAAINNCRPVKMLSQSMKEVNSTSFGPDFIPCPNIQPFHFFIQLSVARGIGGSRKEEWEHSVDFLPSFHVVQWLWLFLCPMERERCVDGLGRGGHLHHQSQWGHGGGRSGEIVFCGRLFRTQLLWGFSYTKWQIHSIFAYRDARSVYTTFVYFFCMIFF